MELLGQIVHKLRFLVILANCLQENLFSTPPPPALPGQVANLAGLYKQQAPEEASSLRI